MTIAAGMLLNVRVVLAQTAAGSISAINGTVTITRGRRSFPAAYATPVQVGDTISTSPNGRTTITLTDGSQLELTESSRMVLSENALNANGTRAKTSVNLLGGLVRSVVRFTAGSPPNFEVHTPNAVASARGTTYDTDYQNGVSREGHANCKEFSDVIVYDGIVEVTNPTNPSAPPVDLHTGQKTTVPCRLAALPAFAAIGAGGAGAAGAAAGAVADLGYATAAVIAGGIIEAGTLGGLGAAGVFNNVPPSNQHHPASPSL